MEQDRTRQHHAKNEKYPSLVVTPIQTRKSQEPPPECPYHGLGSAFRVLVKKVREQKAGKAPKGTMQEFERAIYGHKDELNERLGDHQH